jgi:hypothetical protein
MIMTMAPEQYRREESMETLRKRARREEQDLEDVAMEMGLKMMEGQKDLNDKPGSWADDPDFENCVLDFLNA